MRGFAYAGKDNLDQAVSDYTEAVRLDPKEIVAYRNRAVIFYGKKKYDEAIQDCTAVVRLDPSDADTYFIRAGAYRKKGLTSEVIRDCTEVIRLKPNDSTAYLVRGEAYQQKGLTSEAQSDFARAKALGETVPEVGTSNITLTVAPQSFGGSDRSQIEGCVRKMITSVNGGDVAARRALIDLLAAIQCGVEFQSVARVEVIGVEREPEKLQSDDMRLVDVFDVTLRVSGRTRDGEDISCDLVHLAYPDVRGNWRLRCMDESVVRSWEQQLRQQREPTSPNRQPRSRSRQPTKVDKRQKTASGPDDKEAAAANKLKLARSLLQHNSDAGKTRLRDVVEKYPGTKAATEAQETLDELPK